MEKEMLYRLNPDNVKTFNDDDVTFLKNISDEDLKQLAIAYPNKASRNNYLVLTNNALAKGAKQLYPLSTYENLFNIRTKYNQKSFSIFDIRVKFVNTTTAQKTTVAPAQDLSQKELKSADGIKQGTAQPAPDAGTGKVVDMTNATIPTFDAVDEIVAGSALSPLPMVSKEGIKGTWAPALNNAATTTYTFTPDEDQPTKLTATLDIVVAADDATFDADAKAAQAKKDGKNKTNGK